MQAVAAGGAHPERVLATTPPLVFPSIGPGLIVPQPALAPPVTAPVNVSAEIATPRPRGALPDAERLSEAAASSQEEPSTRRDRKRPRLDTPSPSPAPSTTRLQTGAIRRSNQVLRARAPQNGRQYALALATWMSPTSSQGRLAPAAVAAIAEALLPPLTPVAGPSRLQPVALVAGPSRLPPLPTIAEGTADGLSQYRPNAQDAGVFDMDEDLVLELELTPEREPLAFGTPLRPLALNGRRTLDADDTADSLGGRLRVEEESVG